MARYTPLQSRAHRSSRDPIEAEKLRDMMSKDVKERQNIECLLT